MGDNPLEQDREGLGRERKLKAQTHAPAARPCGSDASGAPRAMSGLARLIHRVRVLTENVKSLALLDVYGRIARLRLELAQDVDGTLVVAERLTQRDIAVRAGASRAVVSLVLKDLKADVYVRSEGHRIVIERPPPPRRHQSRPRRA